MFFDLIMAGFNDDDNNDENDYYGHNYLWISASGATWYTKFRTNKFTSQFSRYVSFNFGHRLLPIICFLYDSSLCMALIKVWYWWRNFPTSKPLRFLDFILAFCFPQHFKGMVYSSFFTISELLQLLLWKVSPISFHLNSVIENYSSAKLKSPLTIFDRNFLPRLCSTTVVDETFYSGTFAFNESQRQIINGLIWVCKWYQYDINLAFRALNFEEMKCW